MLRFIVYLYLILLVSVTSNDIAKELVEKMNNCGCKKVVINLIKQSFGIGFDDTLFVPLSEDDISKFCQHKATIGQELHAEWERCFKDDYREEVWMFTDQLKAFMYQPCMHDNVRKEFLDLLKECGSKDYTMEKKCMTDNILEIPKTITDYPETHWRGARCCGFAQTTGCFMKGLKNCTEKKKEDLLYLWGIVDPERVQAMCFSLPEEYDCDNLTAIDPPGSKYRQTFSVIATLVDLLFKYTN